MFSDRNAVSNPDHISDATGARGETLGPHGGATFGPPSGPQPGRPTGPVGRLSGSFCEPWGRGGRGEGDSTPRRADWFKQIHLLLHQEQRNLVTDRQTPASPAPTHTPPRGPHSSACVSHGFPRRRSIWSWATLPPCTRKVCRADLPSEREALDPGHKPPTATAAAIVCNGTPVQFPGPRGGLVLGSRNFSPRGWAAASAIARLLCTRTSRGQRDCAR